MPGYRLYSLNPFTGHFEGVEELHSSDDVGAIRIAEERAGPVPLELWCGARKVTRVEALPEAMACCGASLDREAPPANISL